VDSPDVKAIYDAYRARNPWLPPGEMVAGSPGIHVNFGLDQMPTMTLQVFVVVPDMVVGEVQHSFYGAPGSVQPEVAGASQDDITDDSGRPAEDG
jgi:hypothetical protein